MSSAVPLARAPFDPRAICNLMLDEAEGHFPLSHLALQKLLYFAHGLHLIEGNGPMVTGYFEAWKAGPVHPSAYQAFKRAGKAPIDFRAVGVDPLTGNQRPLTTPAAPEIVSRIRRVVILYGGMNPNRLVDISHARGGPWQIMVERATKSATFGMRIPDQVIIDFFKHHKVSVRLEHDDGEVAEDTPFACD